jgi:hypothetical protein
VTELRQFLLSKSSFRTGFKGNPGVEGWAFMAFSSDIIGSLFRRDLSDAKVWRETLHSLGPADEP